MLTFDSDLKDVKRLLFSPTGEILAVGELARGTHLLHSQTFAATARFLKYGEMTFSPDGLSVAIINITGIDIYTQGKAPLKLPDTWHMYSNWDSLRFSPDGKQLEANGTRTRAFARWDSNTGNLLDFSSAEFDINAGFGIQLVGTVKGMTYPISSGRALTLITTKAEGKKAKGEAVVFEGDIEKGRIPIDNRGAFPYPMLISSDGRHLVIRWTSIIGIWNLETFAPVARISVDKKPFLDAALTPDGRQLVTVTNNDTHVRFWDLASGELTAQYDWGIGKPTAVAVAPDGLRIACANAKGQIVIWDAK